MRLRVTFALAIMVAFLMHSAAKSTKKPSKKSAIETADKQTMTAKAHGKTNHSKKSQVSAPKKSNVIATTKAIKAPKKADNTAKAVAKNKVVKQKSKSKDKPMKKQKTKTKDATKNKAKDATKTAKDATKAKENLNANAKTEPKADMKQIPSDCNDLVEQYTNGQMVMFEYKAKMARCLKRKKDALPDLRASITPAYDDDSDSQSEGEMTYSDPDVTTSDSTQQSDDSDNYYSDKKDYVPYAGSYNQYNYYGADDHQQQSAAYYPSQDQNYAEQPQVPDQSQAAFAASPMESQQAVVQQSAAPAYTRSDVPQAPQQFQQVQSMESQQAVVQQSAAPAYTRSDVPQAPQQFQQYQQPADKWASAAPAQEQFPIAKKDETPAVHSDPFAQFMRIQTNTPETAPQATQQRSEIQPYPYQAQQVYNAMPANQQATLVRQWNPEDQGLFPENP